MPSATLPAALLPVRAHTTLAALAALAPLAPPPAPRGRARISLDFSASMSTMSCVVYTRAGAGSDSASVFSVPDALSEAPAPDSFVVCIFLIKPSNSACDSVNAFSEAAICASCALWLLVCVFMLCACVKNTTHYGEFVLFF